MIDSIIEAKLLKFNSKNLCLSFFTDVLACRFVIDEDLLDLLNVTYCLDICSM